MSGPDSINPTEPSRGGESMERPWYAIWPEGVPKVIEYPKSSVAGMLARAARGSPEAVATQFYGGRLTFRDIEAAASRFAGGLRRIGGKSGGRVSLLMAY